MAANNEKREMGKAKYSQGFDPGDLGDRDFIHLSVALHRMPKGSHSGWLVHCASGVANAGKLVSVRARHGRLGAIQKMAVAPTQFMAGHISLPRSKISTASMI